MPLNLAGLAIRATSIAGTPCSGRSVSNASPTEGTSARSISQRRVVVAKITCFVSELRLFALLTTPCAQEGVRADAWRQRAFAKRSDPKMCRTPLLRASVPVGGHTFLPRA